MLVMLPDFSRHTYYSYLYPLLFSAMKNSMKSASKTYKKRKIAPDSTFTN